MDPELRVGVAEIDEDHAALLDMMARMHAAGLRADPASARAILEELIDYTDWHFARESAFMEMHRFARATEHRAEHDRLAGQLAGLLDELRDGRLCAEDISARLESWLLGHIADSDRELGAAIRAGRRASRG